MKVEFTATGTAATEKDRLAMKKLGRQLINNMNPRTARYKAREMIQYMMERGYIFDNRDYNLLIKQRIFTREEIRKYRRSLKIAGNHWRYDTSPLREMREYLRAGIPAALIHQYAGPLARRHPFFELHGFYEETIREEMEQRMEAERILEETNYYLETLVEILKGSMVDISQASGINPSLLNAPSRMR